MIEPANRISSQVFVVERTQNTQIDNEALSVLFMTFGQFLDHDLALSPHADCDVRE